MGTISGSRLRGSLSRGSPMRLAIAALWCVVVTSASMAADEPAAAPKAKRQRTEKPGGRGGNEADLLKGSKSHVYKTVNGTELKLHVFAPEGHSPSQKRPA